MNFTKVNIRRNLLIRVRNKAQSLGLSTTKYIELVLLQNLENETLELKKEKEFQL